MANIMNTRPSFSASFLRRMVHEVETALMAAKADGRNRVRALAFEQGHFSENQVPKA
jgi:hypothetical protein